MPSSFILLFSIFEFTQFFYSPSVLVYLDPVMACGITRDCC